ncbi:MAG: glutathione S-transferase, partial [Myxococcota bacterium]
PAFEPVEHMAALYGYTKEAAKDASSKVAETLHVLATRLRAQREAGSRYLIGDELSALDIYWAAFAAMVSPLSQEQCPMPDYLRQSYSTVDETIASALAPELIEHRDFIYENHLELPVVIT